MAEAGLLTGRRATTHWKSHARLAQQYPDVEVDPDPIYIRDGRIWTSAGITAGIDLSLALIQEDLGRKVAMQVARHLVVFLNRPGGQSQFSAPLEAQTAAANGNAPNRFAPLHDWIAENVAGDLRVERLAEQAGMSPRTFARIYTAKIGVTPARMVERIRIEAVRRSLEETDMPIKRSLPHRSWCRAAAVRSRRPRDCRLSLRPIARAIGKSQIDTLIVPGGTGIHEALKEGPTVAWVRRQASTGPAHRLGVHRRFPLG